MTRWRIAQALAALLLTAAACSDSPTENSAESSVDSAPTQSPASGGDLVLGVDGAVTTIAPGRVASPAEMSVALAIYEGLTTYRQGRIALQLAEQIDSDAESTRYTVSLRGGVRFHDGTQLDAGAVIRHFERLKAPSTGCACAVELSQIASMEAPNGLDGRVVVFSLASPNVEFPHLLAGPGGLIESPTAVDEGVDLRSNGVGTGPFVLRATSPTGTYTLEANPSYWGSDERGNQLPYLERLTVVVLPSPTDGLAQLRAGSIDVLQTTDPAAIAQAAELGYSVDKPPTSDTTLLLLNNGADPFDDVRARRALASAIDRTQVNEPGQQGVRLPTDSLFSRESAYYNAGAALPDHDPERARELVDDLGGLRFSILCVSDPETDVTMPAIERLAEAAGIDVTLEIVGGDEFSRRVRDLRGEYEAACHRGRPAFSPDAVRPGLVTGEGANLIFYSNTEVDALLEEGRALRDFEDRRRKYFEVQEIFAAEVPLIPIAHLPFAYVYDSTGVGPPVTSHPSGTLVPARLHQRKGD